MPTGAGASLKEGGAGFWLPESSQATLRVYDETGKVLVVKTGAYNKGYNAIELTKTELGVSGVLYYRLETPTHSATKKMVVIE